MPIKKKDKLKEKLQTAKFWIDNSYKFNDKVLCLRAAIIHIIDYLEELERKE